MDNKDNGGFSYTYSAKDQAEIRSIREKYTDNGKKEGSEDKMERVRRLDSRATQRAQTVALVLGVVGVLILGLGMSLVMSELGAILGAYRHLAMPVGIGIGALGIIPVCLAYPIYNAVLRRERNKIAPEILSLTDELMK